MLLEHIIYSVITHIFNNTRTDLSSFSIGLRTIQYILCRDLQHRGCGEALGGILEP